MENVELEDETSWLEKEMADISQVNDRCEHLSSLEIGGSAFSVCSLPLCASGHPSLCVPQVNPPSVCLRSSLPLCASGHPSLCVPQVIPPSVPCRLKENLLEALAASRNTATQVHVDAAVVDMDSAADKALHIIEKIVFGEKVGHEQPPVTRQSMVRSL
jgi:hypothetical protein